jgi:hypothetical protein
MAHLNYDISARKTRGAKQSAKFEDHELTVANRKSQITNREPSINNCQFPNDPMAS